jgi:hypothetical protein
MEIKISRPFLIIRQPLAGRTTQQIAGDVNLERLSSVIDVIRLLGQQ